jgi:hypothetical protein
MPAAFPDAGEFLADIRALEAAGAEMVGLDGDGPEQQVLLGAMAAVTDRIRLRVPGPGPGEMLGKLSRGRAIGETPGEAWIAIEMPADRESWSAALREHEGAGATGVIVRWDPRLIDLLRNPEPDDRSDLQMSVG